MPPSRTDSIVTVTRPAFLGATPTVTGLVARQAAVSTSEVEQVTCGFVDGVEYLNP